MRQPCVGASQEQASLALPTLDLDFAPPCPARGGPGEWADVRAHAPWLTLLIERVSREESLVLQVLDGCSFPRLAVLELAPSGRVLDVLLAKELPALEVFLPVAPLSARQVEALAHAPWRRQVRRLELHSTELPGRLGVLRDYGALEELCLVTQGPDQRARRLSLADLGVLEELPRLRLLDLEFAAVEAGGADWLAGAGRRLGAVPPWDLRS